MEKPKYYMKNVIEFNKEYVIIKSKVDLLKGKTTTKGEYPKLNSDDKCKFPERACCNYGDFFVRCEFMKCKKAGVWECEYNAKD